MRGDLICRSANGDMLERLAAFSAGTCQGGAYEAITNGGDGSMGGAGAGSWQL